MSDEPTGDCYEAAARFLLDAGTFGDADTLRLVHGVVSGQGPLRGRRIDHAWVEAVAPGVHRVHDMIIDRSNGRDLRLSRGLYYAVGKIETGECRYCTFEEARAMVLKHGHYGPWEEESS